MYINMNKIFDQSFKPKNVIRQSNYHGDRFIPRRKDSNFDLLFLQEVFDDDCSKNDDEEVLSELLQDIHHLECRNLTIRRYYKNNYRKMLNNTITDVDVLKKKMLVYSKREPKKGSKLQLNIKETHWPVFARSKPVIGKPIAILDMPELNTMITKNILDWSSSGRFATIFRQNVIIWNPNQNNRSSMKLSDLSPRNCLKWHPNGQLLYVSSSRPFLEEGRVFIINCDKNELVDTLKCDCLDCTITAIEFCNYLVLGCSQGTLTLFDSNNKLKKTRKQPYSRYRRILQIKASCLSSYIAVSSCDGTVRIFDLPSLRPVCDFQFDLPTKCISWHPNKDFLMAIANQTHLILWNFLKDSDTILCRKHVYPDAVIDAISFNPLSAELVVGYFVNNFTSIVVLKDLDTVVEEVFFHRSRVSYLMWNKNGTELATADAAETLCIWKFFGNPENEKHILQHHHNNQRLGILLTKKYDPMIWSPKLNLFTSHHLR